MALPHYASASVLAVLVRPGWFSSLGFQLGLLGLTGIHLLLDWGKLRLVRWDDIRTFLLDQVLHLTTIITTAYLIAPSAYAEVATWFVWARSRQDKLLALLIIYTGTLFGGGTLLRYAMKPLLNRLAEVPDQLTGTGTYIGWLERFLVLTALVLQSPSTVGLILTAKSVVRYPELKSLRFAEYFLIGTLLSVSLAVLGGIVLVKVAGGVPALSK
jgi:uncharacterized protein DUF3307